jgi:lincosamide nucleotidyltransferase A/C/D/E
VFLFLETDDFWRDHHDLRAAGVSFTGLPRQEPYGTVAVFDDLYGNRWDLIELKQDVAAHAQMTAGDVLELVSLLDAHGITMVIDGGWGVDALLGEQTRRHADLDIAVEHAHGPRIRDLLGARGYTEMARDDTRECNFVMGDARGRLIDIHSYTFSADGGLLFGVPYPPESLTGTGSILGQPVRCITPEWMVRFHSGYPLDDNDLRDVMLLCRRFGLVLPAEHAQQAHSLQSRQEP